MKKLKAKLRWLSYDEGGRRSIPIGDQYISEVKFLEHLEKSDIEGWDLVVNKLFVSDDGTTWHTEVHFRVPEAPQDWLTLGAKFEIYEGKRKVAEGQIG